MFLFSKMLYFINSNLINSWVERLYKESKYYRKNLESMIQSINIPEKKLHSNVVSHLSKLNNSSQKGMPIQLYKSLNSLAYNINKHEYYDEAIMVYLHCLSIITKIPDQDSELAGVLLRAYEPFIHKGDYAKAIKLLKYAYLIYWKKDQVLYMADVTERIGDCYNAEKDFKQAVIFYQKAYTIYEKNNKYSNMAQIKQTIAVILLKTGRSRMVPEYLQKAESLATMDNNYNLLYEILAQSTDLYQLQDKLKYALETVKNNIAVSSKLANGSKGKLIESYRRKSELFLLLGEYENANDDLCSAIDLSRHEEEDYYTLGCLLTYAHMMIDLGDFEGALDCLGSVFDIQQKKPLPPELTCRYYLYAHLVDKYTNKSKEFKYTKELEGFAYSEELTNLDRFSVLFALADNSLSKNDIEGAKTSLGIIRLLLSDVQNPGYEALYLLRISKIFYFDKKAGVNNQERAMQARQKAKEIVKYSLNPRVQFQVYHSLGRYFLKDNQRELAKIEYKTAISIISNMAKNIPESFAEINFYRHPEIYKVFQDFMTMLETEEEKKEAIDMVRALKIQELGLI